MHAVIRGKIEVRKRLTKKWPTQKQRPLSVLIFGIDSVSRLNFIRAMPKTYQHLQREEWFELQGYNKVNEQFGIKEENEPRPNVIV